MINALKPYINRLRSSGLRPTKQRLIVCKVLFDRKDTFHFTIDNLKKKIVGILGLSFKAENDDIRDSLSIKLLKYLKSKKIIEIGS